MTELGSSPSAPGSASGAGPASDRGVNPSPGWRRVRAAAIASALATGCVLLLASAHQHYPIENWLLWHFVRVWPLVLFWAWAALAGGFVLLTRLGFASLPTRERLVLSFAAGVLVFALGLVVVGLLGGLGPVFFFAWPAIMAAPGTVSLVRLLRRCVGHWTAQRRRRPNPVRPLAVLAWLFGLGGALAIALPTFIVQNMAYDARWYHVAIAEQYASVGRVVRFDEGFLSAALPHLASWIYTWAFLSPLGELAHHVRLCAQLELLLVLATLASLQILVEHLVPRPRPRGAWAALFLFPGILLYDSNLSVAADHVLAFWAVPLWLALRRATPAFDRRYVVLTAAFAGAAALTKYQAVSLLAFPAALLAIRAVTPRLDRPRAGLSRALRRRTSLLIGAAVLLVITAPHWLKNLVWHGNPVYPFAHEALGGRPPVPAISVAIPPEWAPQGTLAARLAETVEGTLKFAFQPHDWPAFHGARPVFGYLFSLSLLALPFLRPLRRPAVLAAATITGVFTWYWTYHQDRYLQALLPWMAAVTAATLVLAWRSAWFARVPLVLLVAIQIVDGADVLFLPTHTMMGDSTVKRFADLMSSGYRRDLAMRHAVDLELEAASRLLPPDAKPLIHEQHLRLGLGRLSVSDTYSHQGAIDYTRLGQPAAVLQALRDVGVTHVVWREQPVGMMRLSDDLVFHDFVRNHVVNATSAGALKVAPLPERVTDGAGDLVAVLRCRVALVPVADLDGGRRDQDACNQLVNLTIPEATQALARARFALVDPRVVASAPAALGGWTRLFAREGFEAWSRGTVAK